MSQLENEAKCLYPKNYKCPVCEQTFQSLTFKTGKARSLGQGDYLRPKCDGVEPLKYDAISCPICGYSAMQRYFNQVVPAQRKALEMKIANNYSGAKFHTDAYTYEEAINRYKLALLCDVTGSVAESRIAYTCVKLAWIIRSYLEAEADTLSEEQKQTLEKSEQDYVKNAFTNFMAAFGKEDFPIAGMDEYTVSYLTAELAVGAKHYSDGLRMLSNILGKPDASPRVKDKAMDLKPMITKLIEEEKKKKENEGK